MCKGEHSLVPGVQDDNGLATSCSNGLDCGGHSPCRRGSEDEQMIYGNGFSECLGRLALALWRQPIEITVGKLLSRRAGRELGTPPARQAAPIQTVKGLVAVKWGFIFT